VDASFDERLREDAEQAIGAHGEDLAREAIEAGGALIEGVTSSWESSHGTVRGVRVRLEVDAETLARLAEKPAAVDALQAAFAAAVAKRGPGEVLAELAVRWGVVEAARSSPYRGGLGRRRGERTADAAAGALEGYLAARGREEDAKAVTRAEVTEIAGRWRVVLATGDEQAAEGVDEAAQALFGEQAERVTTRR
jgi:hypothetical protein